MDHQGRYTSVGRAREATLCVVSRRLYLHLGSSEELGKAFEEMKASVLPRGCRRMQGTEAAPL